MLILLPEAVWNTAVSDATGDRVCFNALRTHSEFVWSSVLWLRHGYSYMLPFHNTSLTVEWGTFLSRSVVFGKDGLSV